MRRLNLGCGSNLKEGYINVDWRKEVLNSNYICLVANALNLPFKNGTIIEVFLRHVWEHFNLEETKILIREIKRILCKRGILRIITPNFWDIVKRFGEKEDISILASDLFGCCDLRAYKGQMHKMIWTRKSLEKFLMSAGFEILKSSANGEVVIEAVKK